MSTLINIRALDRNPIRIGTQTLSTTVDTSVNLDDHEVRRDLHHYVGRWVVSEAIASVGVNVRDFGATGNGTSDDGAAINAALATGLPVIIPPGTYMTSVPIEYTQLNEILTFDARATFIKPLPGFTGSQLIRNWTAADWQVSETNTRVAPSNPTHSGTHPYNHYPRIRTGLHLHANGVSEIALFSWAAMQESSHVRLILDSGTSTDANLGLWGVDVQNGVQNAFFDNLVFYGRGWERAISLDGGGSDVEILNMQLGATGSVWDAAIYANTINDVRIRGQMEMNPDAGAFAAIISARCQGIEWVGGSAGTFLVSPPRPLAKTSDAASQLASSITLPQASITLVTANHFPSSGSVWIGGQTVSYTSISGNTLNGCTGGTGTFAANRLVVSTASTKTGNRTPVTLRDIRLIAPMAAGVNAAEDMYKTLAATAGGVIGAYTIPSGQNVAHIYDYDATRTAVIITNGDTATA